MDHFYLFILKEFLEIIIGSHYPREIIWLILMFTYQHIIVGGGRDHVILIKNKIYVCGYYSVIGLIDRMNKYRPTELISLKKSIQLISCGLDYTIAFSSFQIIDSNVPLYRNKLYVWGANAAGELGLGDYKYKLLPKKFILLTGSKIKSIDCGMAHTIILLESSKCCVWGMNAYGQLGLGDTLGRESPQEFRYTEC